MHRLYEHVYVDVAYQPDVQTVDTHASDEIDCRTYDRVMYILNAGVVETGGTVNIKATESATTGGSFADITNAAFVEVAPANDDAVYILDVVVNKSKPFQKLSMVVANDTADIGVIAILYGGNRRLPPDQDKTVVDV